MPVWGAWVNGRLYFGGDPHTRRSRNIAANPAVAIHLESGDQVVIVEGEARAVDRPERSLSERLAAAFSAKYGASGYTPAPDAWDQGGLYEVIPHKAFAWTKFPQDSTSWRF